MSSAKGFYLLCGSYIILLIAIPAAFRNMLRPPADRWGMLFIALAVAGLLLCATGNSLRKTKAGKVSGQMLLPVLLFHILWAITLVTSVLAVFIWLAAIFINSM